MEIIYAYCRFVDDLVDESPAHDPHRDLELWKSIMIRTFRELENCEDHQREPLDGDYETPFRPMLPMARAVAAVIKRYRIPPSILEDVINGVARDVNFRPFCSFAELEEYCAKVASAVGIACLYILGYRGSFPPKEAHDCGVAFQLTNILRDIREDAQRGRIYIPGNELASFGCDHRDLLRGVLTPPWGRLIDFQFARAAGFYKRAAGLFELIPSRTRKVFGLMFSSYFFLFRKLQQKKHLLFQQKVKLSRWFKMWLFLRWLFFPPAALPVSSESDDCARHEASHSWE